MAAPPTSTATAIDVERLDRRRAGLAVAAIIAAMLLGGGGSPAPRAEMVLELLLAGVAALWLDTFSRPGARPAPSQAWLIAGLVCLVPALQLIPLPAALWHALPGRALERQALALIGAEGAWRPWSLTPDRTIAALLAMLPAAAMIVMVAALPRRGRGWVIAAIALLALLSVIVGAAQISAGHASALRFYGHGSEYLEGFQANHNSEADVLLIGIVASAAVARELLERRPQAVPPRLIGLAAVGAIALLAIGVVLTASRFGIMLLPVALAGVAGILSPWLRIGRRFALAGAAATALVAAIVGFELATSTVFQRVVARFTFAGEFRPELWHDALYAMHQYLPWGAGMGSFVPVFMAAERLEVLDDTIANRAHNDFLELAIEAGVPGLLVLAAIVAVLGVAAWQGLKRPPAGSRGQAIFAITVVILIGFHSAVDYPLRSMALAEAAAVCGGLLLPVCAMRLPSRQKTLETIA